MHCLNFDAMEVSVMPQWLRVSAHEQMKFNPARSSIRDGMAE